MIKQAVIMAGGKGTRLHNLTHDTIPKPMIKIKEKPVLQWQIECLKSQGITDIVIVVGHLGEKIVDFLGDGVNFGVSLRYVNESEPLGTAGSLSMIGPYISDDYFLLVFGDILFNIDFKKLEMFHRNNCAEITLFVHPNAHPFDSDLVKCDSLGRVLGFDSKNNKRDYWYRNCVNSGIYLINRKICEQVPKNTKYDLEKDLIEDILKSNGSVYAYKSPEYVKDIGTIERIITAENDISSGLYKRKCLRVKQQAIFLDRDGTLNIKKGFIKTPDEFELVPDACEAIRMINNSGYLAVLITNQPVVARGLCSIEEVNLIHQKMETLLGQEGAFLDEILFCPHHPDKGYPEENPIYKVPCSCRKPATGMIDECVKKYNIDLEKSWMVGDSTVDIKTGKNAGIKTVLVKTGDAGQDGKYDVVADFTVDSLKNGIHAIMKAGEE